MVALTSLIRSLIQRPDEAARSDLALSFGQWMESLQFGGLSYGLSGYAGANQSLVSRQENIGSSFQGYVDGAYKSNGVVFACIVARMLLFSEARFQYQRLRGGRPSDLFGTQNLSILETPWPNGTTGDLLSRAMQDADIGGNSYTARLSKDRLVRMRPDWVTILMGSKRSDWEPGDLDTEVIGYLYHPRGPGAQRDPIPLLPENVAHFAPLPDPTANYRGMSWITPMVREIMGDKAAMEHKLQFFENGATVNLVVKMDPALKDEAFKRWVALFKAAHQNQTSAYETVFLGGGADMEAIGSDMQQIDFKVVQGHGETRVCAAARIPPIIVGLSEGLDSATYSNYGQARRAFADGTMRPLWRQMAGALATIVPREPAARLWYDARDVSFLQEDEKDAAAIRQVNSQSIKALVECGYTPESVTAAVMADDYGLLVHSGLYSVQLQSPGSSKMPDPGLVDPAPVPAVTGQNGRRLLEQFVTARD